MKRKSWKIEIPENDKQAHGRIFPVLPRAEIHRLVQEKAFRLGYGWQCYGKSIFNFECLFLILSDEAIITFTNCFDVFEESEAEQIAWQDFLELPEGDLRGKPISPDFFKEFQNLNDFRNSEIISKQFTDELMKIISESFPAPYWILKYNFTKEQTMKKITISQKITDENGHLTGVKDIKEFRNITITEAAIRYVKECKLENSDNLIYNESIENWSNFK